MPDSGRQSNVGMLAVGDGPPIGGGWGTNHGGCALVFSMFVGKSVVSWPTVGSGLADGGSNNSGGVLRLSLVVCLDLVRAEVPAEESGRSLGPPLSYRRYRREGLLSVGHLPAVR